jgi:hypothetical protein
MIHKVEGIASCYGNTYDLCEQAKTHDAIEKTERALAFQWKLIAEDIVTMDGGLEDALDCLNELLVRCACA